MFDMQQVPFSRHGSFLVISLNNDNGLLIRNIRGGDDDFGEVFKIEVLNRKGEVLSCETKMTPSVLTLQTAEGDVNICFSDVNTIRFYSKQLNLRFVGIIGSYDYCIPSAQDGFEINSFSKEMRFHLSTISGVIQMDAPFEELRCKHIIADICAQDEESGIDVELTEYKTVPRKTKERKTFIEAARAVEMDFVNWVHHTLTAPENLSKGRELAAYITWSCMVEAEGYLPRQAMYMSKNWMTNIWSWDHCFNAMALAVHQPKAAWDQFMIFFDKQDACGVLPDYINDKFALWNCCKPPIHGWTLKWMMERTDFITDKHLQEVYEPLCKWTNWWFTYRDDDKDGIPQYNHGNDSGWDNSTIFHHGAPVESPDLSAFLILQMEVLAEIAEKLGFTEASQEWENRANKTLDRMIQHCWRENRFIAPCSGEHSYEVSESLVLYIPLILGKRLPKEMIQCLLADLKEENRFLTKYGFATESIRSPYYREDGYWRGPIWAPTTLIMIEALKAIGQHEFAQDIAGRFCIMANENGMAENFHAQTGQGLRDLAFTWTSSVFLVLANEYLLEKADKGMLHKEEKR
ncbi:Trehalase [Bacillus sp. 491mf]|uniref:amylo-alpha-1,6-glucosidase n=1 Tax=Bacillus sp. 491mf TaxID=1761755 RepID=UPI0008EF392D|nr:trehalase family glycosidase [Bacillus sp. 491mf]SFC65463.1 Trehalase [Bacillus sp. 491mf]